MSKQTLALIVSLLVVTIVLVVLAILPQQSSTPQTPAGNEPTPTPYAHSKLMFSPNPLTLTTTTGSVDVMIDTGINDVSAVELAIGYDPKKLTNVKATPATFFTKPNVFLNISDPKNGKLTYALVLPFDVPGKHGTGTVATVTFTSLLQPGEQTTLQFLPKTLVTADGVRNRSVLVNATNTTITYTPGASQVSPSVVQVSPTVAAQ